MKRVFKVFLGLFLAFLVLWRGLAVPVHQAEHTAEHLAEVCQDHDGARHWHQAEAHREACALCAALAKALVPAPEALPGSALAQAPSAFHPNPSGLYFNLRALGPYRRGPPEFS